MKRHNVRRLLALVLVAALCLLCGAAAQPNAKEIHIYSADDLVQLSKSCKLDTYSQGKTVYLDNDVDLSGSDFVPIPTFGGTFEGQGHTVSGLELSGDASHMGLFRYVQAVGTVRDLKVTGNIDAAGTLNEIGAIVGTNYGTISGCSFNGTISGENNVGGIAGTNEGSGMIYNCKTEGFVEGDHYVGGIVGQNIGTISYCSNTTGVNINASEAVDSAEDLDSLTLPTASDDEDDDTPKKANTSTDVGGICGFSSGVIIGCTNWGGVGFEHVGYNIGGIVGRQSGLVSGCTNWGTASGRKDVGGICGQMEPFITLDVESGSIGAMAKELNTLHDLMDTLLNHSGAAASSLAATVGVLSDSAARATESARYVAERTTDYVDNTVTTVNEVFIRINTAEKMLAPAITEFSAAAVSLDKSIDYFNKGFDYLDIVDEMTEADKTAFKDAAKDLSVSSDQLNAAMDYCAWLMKVMDNAYGTGSYDLIASRPDNWQQMSDKYGYEYNPDNLGTYESQRDALLKGMGDAAEAIGAISGDISTMTKIINLYYLTEDSTGHTRMDYMSAAFKNAFDALKSSSGNFSTGMSYLDQVTKYLASNDPLNLPDISSDYRTAMEQMFDDLGSISAGLSRLSVETATYSNQIISDMKAVNDQFNVVMMRLCDILELALSKDKDDIIQDVSEEELSSTTDGKVYNCDNYGKIDGDVNVGGVAGTMDIEYDFDPESDSNVIKDSTLTAKYFTKCVLLDSKNYGSATSRKDCVGAICGYADLGVISGCEGYGTAESTAGDYVGGVVGQSQGSVRNSFAKCELTGRNYIGGIAGYGMNVSGCNTLVNLNGSGNCVGTIAGEIDKDGSAADNYFVHETEAGIDGISYAGKAEGMSYEAFMARDGIPAEFSSFAVTFTANGEVVKTITFAYGGSIDESQIPDCPTVEGNYGSWPEHDYSHLTFDLEVKAEYTAVSTVVAGDLYADNSRTPIVLAEGVFDPATDVHITSAEADGPTLRGNQQLYMKYNVEILNDTVEDDTDNTVSLRVYAPDTGASYTVYTYQNGTWASTSSSRDGSYLVFKTMDRDLQFAVTKAHHGPLFYILIVLIVLAVIVAVLRLLYCRKLKKAVAAGTMTEEEAATLRKQGLRMWLGEEYAKLQARHAAAKEAKEAKRAAAAEAKAAAEAEAAAVAAEEAAETAPADNAEAAETPDEPDAPEAEAEPEVTAEDSAEAAEAPADEADTQAQDSDAPQHP